MFDRLFDRRPPRVFLLPGRTLAPAVLEGHRARHAAVPGEALAGHTDHFAIFSDGTSSGDAAAAAMLDSAEADYAAVASWFRNIVPPGFPMQVYCDPDAGGAYHFSCSGTDVHVTPDPTRAAGFLVAEIVEVFQAAQGDGWDCAHTNGESLSRVLAFEQHPTLAPDFNQTEQEWWAAGHQDYVNDNRADDRDQAANGCGDLFLYYLHTQLTFGWADIVAAGGGTLGATYQALTGYDPQQGFADFIAALKTLDQQGQLALPESGNPFPITI
jgi:hypothetical protein